MSDIYVPVAQRWAEDEMWPNAVTELDELPAELGGPGSGFHGHKGIPGHRGGSAPGEGVTETDEEYAKRIRDSIPYDPEHFEKWLERAKADYANLTDVERSWVEWYSDGFYTINNKLTAKKGSAVLAELDPDEKNLVDSMDAALEKCVLPEDTIVYRGTGLHPEEHPKDLKAINLLKAKIKNPQGVVVDYQSQGYWSTSAAQSQAHEFAVVAHEDGERAVTWIVKAPKGTHALAYDSFVSKPDYTITSKGSEQEYIFPRNTKIAIDLVDEMENGDYAIYGTIVK